MEEHPQPQQYHSPTSL